MKNNLQFPIRQSLGLLMPIGIYQLAFMICFTRLAVLLAFGGFTRMKRYSIVFTSLPTTSGLSFKGFAFESLLAVPKESRCSLLRTPTFFDRCGTSTFPVSATGGGKARAPTSFARRSHNPKT